VSDDPAKTAPTVSMSKSKAADAPRPERPRSVLGAVAAMGASALAALIASVALFGQRDWLTREQVTANNKAVNKAVTAAVAKAKSAGDSAADIKAAGDRAAAKTRDGFPNLHHQISQQQSGALIGTIVVVVALAVLAFTVYRGRYWARWGVVAFWLLASFSGTVVGIGTVLSVTSDVPGPFKVPAFASALLLIVAVVLVNAKTSTSFFALSKPVPSPDAPVRRGLFAPRTPAAGGRAAAGRSGAARGGASARSALTSSAATRGEAYVERQRAKKRAAANAESVARGAELARNRAKASKSRRIER
jgi:hypothetical protein